MKLLLILWPRKGVLVDKKLFVYAFFFIWLCPLSLSWDKLLHLRIFNFQKQEKNIRWSRKSCPMAN